MQSKSGKRDPREELGAQIEVSFKNPNSVTAPYQEPKNVYKQTYASSTSQ